MQTILLTLQSIVLGIVEGVTEFLPISSTGHMIIFENLLGFHSSTPHYVEMYTYVIQLGAILAVVVLFWPKIWQTIKTLIPKKGQFLDSGLSFWLVIVTACIPGLIATLLLDNLAEQYLFNPISVAIVLFLGGILMIVMENLFRKNQSRRMMEDVRVSYRQALIIGLFQCLSILPGMSRSASTIMGGWVAGLSTPMAAEFSFFLAIPVMIGMSFLKLVKIGGFGAMTSSELIALIIGFVVAFLSALVVVKKFIHFLQRKPLRPFAIYRMIFAVVVLICGFIGIFK